MQLKGPKMLKKQRTQRCALVWLLFAFCSLVAGAEREDAHQFLRIERDADKNLTSLQTAIVRYQPKEKSDTGAFVDLIGVVHIGEKAYYEQLNKIFGDYDAVLYELVAPVGENIPAPGRRSGHPVGVMQVAMKNILDLEFQLDRVDYRRAQFVHADLSPEEFNKSMEARNDSLSKLFFRLMGQGLAQQSKDPARTNDVAVFSALFSRERSIELKRTMAVQFEEMEVAASVLDGPDGSAIITDRNKRALEVLSEQIKAGKKKLAIFYGAAHLPDFNRRLRADMSMAPTNTRWLVAWDLRSAEQRKQAGN
jgi:hypothetical protein